MVDSRTPCALGTRYSPCLCGGASYLRVTARLKKLESGEWAELGCDGGWWDLPRVEVLMERFLLGHTPGRHSELKPCQLHYYALPVCCVFSQRVEVDNGVVWTSVTVVRDSTPRVVWRRL